MDPNEGHAYVQHAGPEPDWKELRARMLRICSYNLRGRLSPDEVEAVVQDTMLELYEKHLAGEIRQDIERLAAKMAKFASIDVLRRKRRDTPLPDDLDQVPDFEANSEDEAELPTEELAFYLRQAIAQIGAKCRRLFEFRMKLRNMRLVAEALGLEHAAALQQFKRCKDGVIGPWLADDGPLGTWVRGRLGLS